MCRFLPKVILLHTTVTSFSVASRYDFPLTIYLLRLLFYIFYKIIGLFKGIYRSPETTKLSNFHATDFIWIRGSYSEGALTRSIM